MSDLNEFAINLPMSSVPAMTASTATAPAPDAYDIMSAFALPPEIDTSSCSHITVSCDSSSTTNYDPADPNVCVELVLSVNVRNDVAGTSSTYKLVKRLKLDKCKLAYEAESLTPVQVVEDQEDPLVVAQQMNEFYAKKRARELSGLVESAGDKKFKILFSMKSEDGSARIGGQVNIDKVKDAAHARHVFDVKHASKYKARDVKITRATEIKEELTEEKQWAVWKADDNRSHVYFGAGPEGEAKARADHKLKCTGAHERGSDPTLYKCAEIVKQEKK